MGYRTSIFYDTIEHFLHSRIVQYNVFSAHKNVLVKKGFIDDFFELFQLYIKYDRQFMLQADVSIRN